MIQPDSVLVIIEMMMRRLTRNADNDRDLMSALLVAESLIRREISIIQVRTDD